MAVHGRKLRTAIHKKLKELGGGRRLDMDMDVVPASGVGQGHRPHNVQFYTDDRALIDVLRRFVGGALAAGDAAIVIATQAHHEALARGLREEGLETDKAIQQGRYILADAGEALSRLTQNGRVDEAHFFQFMNDLLTRARSAAECRDGRVAVFGEMVALLWAQGKAQEALRLEQFWNDLSREHYFSLLCAYPVAWFDNDPQIEPFLQMCSQHSGVVTSESYLGGGGVEDRLRTIADLQQKTLTLENILRLRQSEERFRLFVEAVRDYAIFMLDPEGNVASWNTGAQRIKGYKSEEIIGKHFSCFYPPEDVQHRKPQWGLQVAAQEGRFEDEGWRVRKDGSRFWANVIITAVRDAAGNLIGFGKVTRDVTEKMLAQISLQQEVASRKLAEIRLLHSERSLRQLSYHLLRSQDEERRRLGRELHDSLGQYLVAIKISLDSLAALGGCDAVAASQTLAECTQLVESAIREVRTISYLLYPPMLDETGLKSAISWYLEGFSARSGIQTSFDVQADFARPGRDAEVALFRVLQESLTNIHRHSGAATAAVRLLAEHGEIVLEIKDNGRGISPSLLEESAPDWSGIQGVGLRGMNERMEQLGGKLQLVSDASGTTVRATIPMAESSSDVARSA
jgi:PAS domain S-box-containing protein